MTEEEKAQRKAARAAEKAAGNATPPARKRAPRPAPKAQEPAAATAKSQKTVEQPEQPADDKAQAEQPTPATPLDYMLQVMRDPASSNERRDRMAIAAAPFVHPRREPVGQGKREGQRLAAEKAGQGRFGARRPPLKLVGTGG